MAALSFLLIWVFYKFVTHALQKYLEKRVHKKVNAKNFLLGWRYSWLGIGLIFVLASYSGSLAALGLSAAFVGMILGWSLQAPVTGIAAWLMILLKRPFRIGDRVIISGVTGDVSDITLTHVLLNQVGGTVSGEEKSGRGVLIPNATLFQQIIYNYTFESRFLLDEITVLVTYDSSVDEAEKLLLKAVRNVTEKIIVETKKEPFVRMEFFESGIRMRLRYQTNATDRQRISSDVTRQVFKLFKETDQVHFCYPHSRVLASISEQPPTP